MKKIFSFLLLAIFLVNTSNVFSQLIGVEVIIQPDPTTGKDAFISSSNPSANYGSYEDLVMLASGTTNLMRALIQFDLSSIPSNVGIETVDISFRGGISGMTPLGNSCPPNNTNTNNSLWLERVTQNWQESTVNWNNQPQTTQTDRVQVTESNSTSDYLCNIPNTWSLMAMVQHMVSNPSSNYGFMLKLKNEDGNRNMAFKSSDYNNEDALKYRPQIYISYSIPDFTYCINTSKVDVYGNYEYTFDSSPYSTIRVDHEWTIDGNQVPENIGNTYLLSFSAYLTPGTHQVCHKIISQDVLNQVHELTKCITICVH
ncbi:MAG TPA: hypothetical protein DD434_14950 [Bacteroidales bacterium]|nr:hypothetical protein [Bacteroidales bacterium]